MKKSILFLVMTALAFSSFAQDTVVSGAAPASSPDKAKLLVQDHVENLAKSIEAAKTKLQQATTSPEARQVQFDEIITTINQALAEVSEGGETYSILSTAIQQAESKMKEYKTKMSDPGTSPKTQEVYQRLAGKFKQSAEDLYRSKMSLNTRQADLNEALKMAVEQRTLFIDMIQADQLLEANEAVKNLADAMSKVTDSINDMATELGVEKPAAPVLR
jgi:chromosome segregation ATPase